MDMPQFIFLLVVGGYMTCSNFCFVLLFAIIMLRYLQKYIIFSQIGIQDQNCLVIQQFLIHLFKNCHSDFQSSCAILFPPAMYEDSNVSISCQFLLLSVILLLQICHSGYKTLSYCGSTCIFIFSCSIDYFYISVEESFQILCPFLFGLSLMNCNSLSILKGAF